MLVENKSNSGFDEALSRFNRALEALEGTINGHLEGQRSIQDAEDEVQSVNSDRVELAESLDKSEARAARLENINMEVSRRLVTAMEAIRGIINSRPVDGSGS
jgi:uncharacterized protein YlxW (UPF0749 family)